MKYKLIILDLDGTTVPSRGDGMPSIRVKEAVLKAQKYIKVSIASGRPLSLCKKITDDLLIDGPCVFNGGAEIINPKTGELLFKKFLQIEKQKEVIRIALSFNYIISAGIDEHKIIKSPEDIDEECGKILIEGISNSDVIKMLEELDAVKGIKASPTTSWINGDVVDLHITHENATKRHAVEELIKILDFKKEDVIGVGDHHNDMPLFASVGFKAVMGNAPHEVKNIADYIAPTLDEDGVANVIEKFVLLK